MDLVPEFMWSTITPTLLTVIIASTPLTVSGTGSKISRVDIKIGADFLSRKAVLFSNHLKTILKPVLEVEKKTIVVGVNTFFASLVWSTPFTL